MCENNQPQFVNEIINDLHNQYIYDDDITLNKNEYNDKSYDFGVCCSYWNPKDDNYVKQKYKHLKEEITQNELCKLSIELWNDLNKNSITFIKSDAAKKYLPYANGHNYNLYRISSRDSIKIWHLKSLYLYTGYTSICNSLCASFRKSANETDHDVRQRNSEYAIWSRYLCESVQCYGRSMSDEKESIQTVFRGIDKSFIFERFIAKFNSPVSTSKDVCYYLFFV